MFRSACPARFIYGVSLTDCKDAAASQCVCWRCSSATGKPARHCAIGCRPAATVRISRIGAPIGCRSTGGRTWSSIGERRSSGGITRILCPAWPAARLPAPIASRPARIRHYLPASTRTTTDRIAAAHRSPDRARPSVPLSSARSAASLRCAQAAGNIGSLCRVGSPACPPENKPPGDAGDHSLGELDLRHRDLAGLGNICS